MTVRAGEDRAAVDLDRLRAMERERIEREYLCASGERWGGVWRGVPVAAVLEAAGVDIDGDATHLRVVDAGDYAVCVPVATALSAHLAVERDCDPLPPERGPRFLARVDAGKTVKSVRELELLRLDPSDDPEEYENLGY
ncbi:molybdopterin-dependent oxidoreductase [Halobaculum roseum]|uniref:Molybdopterin-dependent oxidoreductase n=1 Tax=Halobaculum roseum TaxID=2175149 RepID=A0ABD5MQK8_9EURY|nr:molybdopterin-dependent oxidoreductase [Halobaculum roseum]